MLLKMNLELCERLSRQSNGYVLNSNSWLASAGSNAYNAKLWYLAKIPFALEVFEAGKPFNFLPLVGTHMVSEPLLRLRRQTRIMDFFDGELKPKTK